MVFASTSPAIALNNKWSRAGRFFLSRILSTAHEYASRWESVKPGMIYIECNMGSSFRAGLYLLSTYLSLLLSR